MFREFTDQPLQNFKLVACRSAPDLRKQFCGRWPVQREVRRALIAYRTYRAQIARLVRAAM